MGPSWGARAEGENCGPQGSPNCCFQPPHAPLPFHLPSPSLPLFLLSPQIETSQLEPEIARATSSRTVVYNKGL